MASPQKYMLQDLLNVRLSREETAAKALARQKEVVAAVEKELARQRNKLREYKKWRAEQENELFAEIINQIIHSKDLEDLRFRIQRLRDDQAKLESQVLETANRLESEKQVLVESKQQYYDAYRQRDKLEEHKSAWIREAAREQEFQEEKEIEDFRNRSGLPAYEGV